MQKGTAKGNQPHHRQAVQAASAAAEAATQAASAAKAAAEAAEVAATLKKAAGLETDEAQVDQLQEAAVAAVATAEAAQAEAAESHARLAAAEAAEAPARAEGPAPAEASAPPVEATPPVAPQNVVLEPVAEVKEEEEEKKEEKKEEEEEVKEEELVEIEVEEQGDLAKGDTKRKEPETGFVSHLHKNKGREVPKAAAKSRDSSRSSESSSRPDYNRSSSAEPSSAPPSPGPPSGSRGPEAPAPFLEKEKSLEKGMDVEEPKRKVVLLPKLPGMVAVDWYKTVEQPNGELDTESLQKLKDSNVRVWIVSFCGKSQARKVKQKCAPLRDQGLIEGVSCINERCGQWGKVSLCQEWGINHLFDDGEDICWEGAAQGMHVYPLLAGNPAAHCQLKAQYNVENFWDLGDAVAFFFEKPQAAISVSRLPLWKGHGLEDKPLGRGYSPLEKGDKRLCSGLDWRRKSFTLYIFCSPRKGRAE